MKIKIKIILLLLSFFLAHTSVYGADIVNIIPRDLKNLDFSLSPKVPLVEWPISSEIKILKDLQIISSVKDFKDSNKIILNLKNSLIPNKAYNLLSVFWVDWNIDFSIWNEITLIDIKNPDNVLWIQWISRLLIIDSKTIEVYFNNPIDATEFEFKLYRESKINKVTNSGSILSINLLWVLDKSSKYILMMISLSDKFWLDVKFTQEIYDFTTSSILWDKQILNIQKNTTVQENNNLNKQITWSWNIENVALNSAITPESWPTTWVLIFLTFLVNIFIILKRKLIK